MKIPRLLALLPISTLIMAAQPTADVRILLPERTRLLTRQRVDLVVEARRTAADAKLRVFANDREISTRFSPAVPATLDCDGTPGLVFRADLMEFPEPGIVRLRVELNSAGTILRTERTIEIRAFSLPKTPRNYVLFIGDAMGNAYRDAARIVSRSVETKPGVPGLREGFFDRWLEMDQMPVTGLVMTYGFASLVPDSAETGTHWASGNKPLTGMLGAFPDGTDCRWRGRTPAKADDEPLSAIRDNPKIETMLEYLKRLYSYRTGDVSTAFITDATPAAQGSHVATREATFEIARQYLENPILGGKPALDLIMGGGKEDFDPDIRSDRRNLIAEFERSGYKFVSTATELRLLKASDRKTLGLFRRPNEVKTDASGLHASNNGNMETAYDKLGLLGRANRRPGSEPLPDFGKWTDQPFLEDLTAKAIELLSGPSGAEPFALQVEGALIDKESHPNHAAGTIWDTIELDHAVGVARKWAHTHPERPTLILVTGDHDQTMSILGSVEISDADLTNREPVASDKAGGKQVVYRDAVTNLRSDLTASSLPAEVTRGAGRAGMPDYQDTDGDGYPENREVNGKGRKRIAVGFRTGGHAGSSLPITAEGPGAALFMGYMDQTDIFFRSAQALSMDLKTLDKLVDATHSLQAH
jgi:alkaline phosphatase